MGGGSLVRCGGIGISLEPSLCKRKLGKCLTGKGPPEDRYVCAERSSEETETIQADLCGVEPLGWAVGS